MKVRLLLTFTIMFMHCVFTSCENVSTKQEGDSKGKMPYVFDMVHNNPGEGPTTSVYNNPAFLKERDYNGMVPQWYVQCAITYDNFEAGIISKGSEERKWIEERAQYIDEKLKECDEAGIDVYPFTDIFVAPASLWKKYGKEMGEKPTSHGNYGGAEENVRNPNIRSQIIQDLVRAQIEGIFERFPTLDGLVTRFGETYLHDTPYHMGGKPVRQGDEGIADHVILLNILREEVCVKRNKKLFYRTWDFGWLHTRPNIYLAISNQVEPHENLIFSIKHTRGDFHRKFPLNPTLTIGKHKQIVEVQCQREYEGKGAHPNYIGEAVINGFEETKNLPAPQSLYEVKDSSNIVGVWTWSRGGGWKGPYISNELWCDLNAYVVGQWANNPDTSEKEIFADYCEILGLSEKDALTFREIALLSNRGVLFGRTSTVGNIKNGWIRDEFIGGLMHKDDFSVKKLPYFDKNFYEIIQKELVDTVLSQKQLAVDIWREIEEKSKTVKSGDDKFRDYLKVSSSYGRIKYEIIQQGWIIMLKGFEGELNNSFEKATIQKTIKRYDELWVEFKALKENNPQCASLYRPYAFNLNKDDFYGEAGLEQTVRKYERLIQ